VTVAVVVEIKAWVLVVVTEDETNNPLVVVSGLVVNTVDVWSCVVLPIEVVVVDVTGACDVDPCFQIAQSGQPPCERSRDGSHWA
jgi:hypothetical protein